jgi:hypothetical protein
VTAALVARTAWDTLALAWRVHLTGSYDPAASGEPSMAASGRIGAAVGRLGPLQPAQLGEGVACAS